MKKTIYLATDHAGFALKNAVKQWLQAEGFAVEDCGAYEENAEDDFTDFISKVAYAVAQMPQRRVGIIFGGSGQGEAILANRYLGVRAAVYYGGEERIVALSREHNDANVLSIGARFVDEALAKKVIWDFLHTDALPDQKYKRRNSKIRKITMGIIEFFGKEIK